MKTISLTVCLLLSVVCVAQDATQPKDWIRKFEGSWTTKSHSIEDDTIHEGTMKSHSIGDKWIVNEFQADMGGFAFHALQTLGYDPAKKVYTATWVDNAFDLKWSYEGKLEEEKNQLVFIAEGPDLTGKGGTARYRDIYEFKNQDLIVTTSQLADEDGQWNTFMTGKISRIDESGMATKPSVAPLLMFEGDAEKAMQFYVSVLPDSEIETVTKYDEGESGKAGSIKHAMIRVAGTRLLCIDSPVDHEFEFTPSISLFVNCESGDQVSTVFKKLADGGKVLMPLDDYGFSTQFGWVTDRYGVSWQLNFGELK